MDIQKEKRKLILIAVVFFLAIAVCFLIIAFAKPKPEAKTDYSAFFTTDRVHSVEATLSEEDWQDLCAHPLDKTKYPASVTIDGESVEEISISTKGNSSLTNVAEMENSNRYSFSLQFDKFRKGQTFHGLDRMKLSNLFHDESAMSDYLSYRISQEAGGYAPLCTYAWLRINGKDYGLILAVEEIRQNATVAQDQTEYNKRFDALSQKFNEAEAKKDAVVQQISDIRDRLGTMEDFLRILKQQDGEVTAFSEKLWCGLLDYATAYADGRLTFTFKNGSTFEG